MWRRKTVTVKPRLGLTGWLAILVLGAIVPLLLFAGLTLRGVLHTSRALADRGQVDTTRALALAVDGEVRAWRAALLTLASSSSLQRGRWADFYEEAREVATRHEGWVVVNPATGPQRLNTLRPFGAPLPQTAASNMVQAVFREGKPVTDMTFGAVAQRYIISNSIPVFRDGKVVLCLSLNFGPERLTRLLQSQQFPEAWVAALNDSQGRVVARSRDAEARVGKPVVEWFAAATRASESGMVTGPMIDEQPGQIAFERLQEAPWIVALAIPVAELQSAAPILGFISIGAILGLVAVGMAVYIGRKMTGPVRSLARASEGLLRGEAGYVSPPTGIRELRDLEQALAKASAAARAHAAEREQAAEALRQANEELEKRVLERTAALASANEALRAAIADLQEEIGQRRRAEENVRTLARFPSENPNPVLRLDSEGRILFANAASAPVLDQWGTEVGSGAPVPWPDAARDALTNNSGTTIELVCRERTYIVFMAPVPEAEYVNLYMSDITDRKHAEMALEMARADAVNEKNRLEAVLQALPVGMALVDAQGGSTRANAAYEQVWGSPRPIARTVADYALYKAWWADTGQSVQPAEWASAQAVQQKRPVIGQLLEIERFDGARAFVLNSAAPIFGAEGEVTGAAVAIQDITDLRKAQEALRRSEALYHAIGESINYGVWVCAPDGRNTYASESFLKLVGLTQQQCADFGWGAVLHPDDADRTIAAWKACVRTGNIWDIEHRFRGVDGQWHHILARGVPVKDERGEVLCWAGINLDIGRLKRAEAALRQLNAELEQRVTERTAALAQAVQALERQAQQLRTLTAELTLAEQRERRRLADMLHDELQQLLVATRLRAHMLGRAEDAQVRQGSQEIVELIEEALAATRSLTGEMSPPTLRNGNLLATLELLTRWMQQRHKFTVRLGGPAAPVPLLSEDHAVLMYQSVRELLLNTVKYARVDAADVTVTQDTAGLTLTVADAGVGFEPSLLRVAGGTEGGFGLLGIRERLEAVGGHLQIASAPGEGSRFTLVIPLAPVPETAPVVRPVGVPPAAAGARPPAGRRTRVLIVDDHALVRRGFATLLARDPDLSVVGEAADGQMAIELTRQLAPNVILMDISMPVLNGIEATRAIHAEFPAVRVIGLSMFEVVEQAEAMRQAGAVGYLSKNDSAEALLAAIRGGGESEG
jgi:PAS domain S-box-containing protein